MTSQDKAQELHNLSNLIRLEWDEEKVNAFKQRLFNSDFLILNDHSIDVEKKIRKLIRKIGIKKPDGKFYQLFYSFNLMFDDKSIKFIMLNNEIDKFFNLFKQFVLSNASFVSPEVHEKINGFTFVNNTFIEDYKILGYKSNLISIFNKYEITNRVVYKSGRMSLQNNTLTKESFDILKNDEYKDVENGKLVNNKLHVISNFLYMFKDLGILTDFK